MLQRPNQTAPSQPTLYYRGILQCDGYSAYETLARKVPGIQLAGCMAHVRRKFKDALQHSPTQALWIIIQIKHLYRIERKLSNQNAGARYRNHLRQVESRPILARIKKALLIFKANASILPQSTLGRAVDYALGQWEGLQVYITEGCVGVKLITIMPRTLCVPQPSVRKTGSSSVEETLATAAPSSTAS